MGRVAYRVKNTFVDVGLGLEDECRGRDRRSWSDAAELLPAAAPGPVGAPPALSRPTAVGAAAVTPVGASEPPSAGGSEHLSAGEATGYTMPATPSPLLHPALVPVGGVPLFGEGGELPPAFGPFDAGAWELAEGYLPAFAYDPNSGACVPGWCMPLPASGFGLQGTDRTDCCEDGLGQLEAVLQALLEGTCERRRAKGAALEQAGEPAPEPSPGASDAAVELSPGTEASPEPAPEVAPGAEPCSAEAWWQPGLSALPLPVPAPGASVGVPAGASAADPQVPGWHPEVAAVPTAAPAAAPAAVAGGTSEGRLDAESRRGRLAEASARPEEARRGRGAPSGVSGACTTVMLRNVPNKYTREMLVRELSREFRGQFDFLYLPIDFKNGCNIGYGFINFRSAEACERFVAAFDGVDVRRCLPGLFSRKVAEVRPARVQGLEENVQRLRASPVMTELARHPEWMPLLLDEDGQELPFPEPQYPVGPLRPRGQRRVRTPTRETDWAS